MALARGILFWLPLQSLLDLETDLLGQDFFYQRALVRARDIKELRGATREKVVEIFTWLGEISADSGDYARWELCFLREIYSGGAEMFQAPQVLTTEYLEAALEARNWSVLEEIIAGDRLHFSTFDDPRLLERHAGAKAFVARHVRQFYSESCGNIALIKLAGFLRITRRAFPRSFEQRPSEPFIMVSNELSGEDVAAIYLTWERIGLHFRREWEELAEFENTILEPIPYSGDGMFSRRSSDRDKLTRAFAQLLPSVVKGALPTWKVNDSLQHSMYVQQDDLRIIEPGYLQRAEQMLALLPQLRAKGQSVPELYEKQLLVLLGRPVSWTDVQGNDLIRLRLEMLRVAHPMCREIPPRHRIDPFGECKDHLSTVFYDLPAYLSLALPKQGCTRHLKKLFVYGQAYDHRQLYDK